MSTANLPLREPAIELGVRDGGHSLPAARLMAGK
jgi:hypothetical protein